MKTILVVIMVLNGRFYEENVKYVVEYQTEAACLAVQRTFPTVGIRYEKAKCVEKRDSIKPAIND